MIRRQTNDKTPNNHQRSSLWRECTTFKKLRQIHASMIINGFNTSRFNLREVIYVSALVIPSGISYAHQVFDHITQPDLFMWNTMLRGSAQSPTPAKTVSLFTQMEKQGVRPDRYTFPFVLKACTKLSWANVGCAVHGKITKHGLEQNTFSKNTLIYFHANVGDIDIARALFECSDKTQVVAWSALTAGYARRGDLGMARKVFDEMPERDLISWNVMMTGYAKRGDMESARELFDQVPKRDIVTWNAMIAGYVNHGLHADALKMFEEMKDLGEQPDEVTMLSLVTACTDSGDLDIGEKIHRSVLDLGGGELSILLGNALIDMYAKCGNIDKALNIFRSMKEKVVTTWNSIIGGLAFHGHSEEAINIFNEMCRLKLKPNDISFVGVLVACSHAGRVEEGREYFRVIREKYNIEPNIRHYGCMVDLLGRAGLLKEAFEFVDKMEMKPNAIIWRTLLGSCTIHNNVELGRRANEELVKLRWGESGDYVLLSNIYASQGEWLGAQSVRKVMDDKGVRKEAASSLVDADEESLMHFLFDSKSECQTKVNKKAGLIR
ncbi:pentatricopeptide repeat-containing protein At5g15300-like [Bidens hawaiensis]|uniref:pentatricopeptide repeat-containing protein At5g15300-like n=1 Tax=Bidens hawaiensis TaxID=980011 RepID=UPI00404A9990